MTALYVSNGDGVVWCSFWSGLMKDRSVRTVKEADTQRAIPVGERPVVEA